MPSPMPLIQQGSPPIRVRLTGDDLRFPICEDLKAMVGTDDMVQGLPHASGEIGYGNIGAKDRLDFTVISAAVNETCRLETLCQPLKTPLTMSEAFVKAAQPEAVAPLQVFTLGRYVAPPV